MLRESYVHCLLIFLLLKYALLAFGFTPRPHLTRSHGRVHGPFQIPFQIPFHDHEPFQGLQTAVRACPVRPASFGEPWFPHDKRANGTRNQFPLAPRPYMESSRGMLNQSQQGTETMHKIQTDMADMQCINEFVDFEFKDFGALCEHVILLQNKFNRLETITQELCTSIIRCDDMLLLERDLMHQGAIFTSSGRHEGLLKRAPTTLRSSVLEITNQYNMPLAERTHVWNVSADLDP